MTPLFEQISDIPNAEQSFIICLTGVIDDMSGDGPTGVFSDIEPQTNVYENSINVDAVAIITFVVCKNRHNKTRPLPSNTHQIFRVFIVDKFQSKRTTDSRIIIFHYNNIYK